MFWFGWWACGGSAERPEAVEGVPEVPDAADERLRAAEQAVGALATGVRGRLQEAMAEGGPDAAIRVCAADAQVIAQEVTERTGVRVGRASLRLRNPANQPPDWVAAWLAAQGERAAEGVAGFARVEGEGAARVARVLKPIPVEPVCLTCHGPVDTLAEPIRAVLAERYPQDAAVGYAAGDLRGAVWAEASVVR